MLSDISVASSHRTETPDPELDVFVVCQAMSTHEVEIRRAAPIHTS